MRSLVYFILLLRLRVIHSNAETHFKNSCRNLPQRSAYVWGKCLVLHQAHYMNRSVASAECVKQPEGHLAVIYSQQQITKLSALFELNTPAWCALARDKADPNLWFHSLSENGPTSEAPDPPWDPSISPNPDPTAGDGVLVDENGLKNADLDTEHPFLCQFPETADGGIQQFSLRKKGSKASNTNAFDQCALSTECHLYFVPVDALKLSNDSDYEIFDRKQLDSDTDRAEGQLGVILIISGHVNIEVYNPNDATKNRIVQSLDSILVDPAVELYDGKVLVTGGNVAEGGRACLWLDPHDHFSISSAPWSSYSRRHHGHTNLDGAPVQCGGHTGAAGIDSCEKFINNEWVAIPPLTVPRYGFKMVNLDGTLYAAGGATNAAYYRMFEKLEPGASNWTRLNDLPEGRHYPGMTVYQGGIYIAGGQTSYTSCKKYNVQEDSWTAMGSLNTGRYGLELLVFEEKMCAISGNSPANAPLDTVEVYDNATDSWSVSPHSLIHGRVHFSAIVV